jgi:undecaprenyl-diphosphatase
MTAGLFGGLDRSTAARFAFLLGIPITAGAGGLKALHVLRHGMAAGDGGPLAAALLASFLAGWAAIWFLVGYLRRNSLVPFVIYRVALGLVLLALVLR